MLETLSPNPFQENLKEKNIDFTLCSVVVFLSFLNLQWLCLLDKFYICASMYLSILLLDRASIASRDDLDRRWDHRVIFLTSCDHVDKTGVKASICNPIPFGPSGLREINRFHF